MITFDDASDYIYGGMINRQLIKLRIKKKKKKKKKKCYSLSLKFNLDI